MSIVGKIFNVTSSLDESNGKNYVAAIAVSEPNQNGYVTFYIESEPKKSNSDFESTLAVELKDSNQLTVDISQKLNIPITQAIETNLAVSLEVVEKLFRASIANDTRLYYQAIEKPKQTKEFTPGDRVPYAARVFDEKEMCNLVDSSLDFWLTSGRFADKFERDFAKKIGVRHCSLTNSGSSANLLAFSALTSPQLRDRRILPGDEVIGVAAAFPTTVAPIVQYGAIPVFCDITVDDGTYNINVEQLEEARSERTKAVMIAHTLGNPFNLEKVKEFCDKHGLWLIEDNCDALGSLYDGKLTGTFGDIATSSFYPPHHMTMGEGGAVYTNKPALKKLINSFRDWGKDCWCAAGKDNTCGKRFDWKLGQLPSGYDHKHIFSHFGYNLKVTDMQAAVGCMQLDKVDGFTKARRQNWDYLSNGLKELGDDLILPQPTPKSEPSWFGFVMSAREGGRIKRNEIVPFLEERSIQTRMLFAGNLLSHPCFDEMRDTGKGYRCVGDLPETDRVLKDTFLIGVYPGLSKGQLDYMIDSIVSFAKSK